MLGKLQLLHGEPPQFLTSSAFSLVETRGAIVKSLVTLQGSLQSLRSLELQDAGRIPLAFAHPGSLLESPRLSF